MWGLCKEGFLNRIFIVSAPQGQAAQRLVIIKKQEPAYDANLIWVGRYWQILADEMG